MCEFFKDILFSLCTKNNSPVNFWPEKQARNRSATQIRKEILDQRSHGAIKLYLMYL